MFKGALLARPYDMSKRNAAAESTRRRIIDAAHRLLADGGGGRLSVQDVAAEAGVTRATLYNRIGPRRELLATVFRDQGRLIEYHRVQEAIDLEDVEDAVGMTVRESCRAWSALQVPIRKTLALATLDGEASELVQSFEASRRRGLAKLARRLNESGRLGPLLDVASGTGALATLTSFQAYDQLSRHVGPDEAVRQLESAARAVLVSSDPTTP